MPTFFLMMFANILGLSSIAFVFIFVVNLWGWIWEIIYAYCLLSFYLSEAELFFLSEFNASAPFFRFKLVVLYDLNLLFPEFVLGGEFCKDKPFAKPFICILFLSVAWNCTFKSWFFLCGYCSALIFWYFLLFLCRLSLEWILLGKIFSWVSICRSISIKTFCKGKPFLWL